MDEMFSNKSKKDLFDKGDQLAYVVDKPINYVSKLVPLSMRTLVEYDRIFVV